MAKICVAMGVLFTSMRLSGVLTSGLRAVWPFLRDGALLFRTFRGSSSGSPSGLAFVRPRGWTFGRR